MSNETLLVKINHYGLIPLVGPGPILEPIRVTAAAKATIEALIGKGKVEVIGEEKEEVKVVPEPVKQPEPVKVPETPKVEEVKEEATTLEVTEEEESEETQPFNRKKKNK